jgi:hypothetical protein
MATKDTQKNLTLEMPEEKQYLTLDSLLKMSDLRQKDVYIKRLQSWVTIRELSAEEVLEIRKACSSGKGDTFQFDALKNLKMQIQASMVNPKLTLANVETLFKGGTSAADELTVEIEKLNGVAAGSEKEAENSFRGQPGEEVPLSPGE